MIEPEIKLVFAALFLLMWLGDRAHSHAVLPAFVLGLAMSSHYHAHRLEQERLRVVAFAFLTPFFFLKGGMSVSAARSGRTSASWPCCSPGSWSRSSPAIYPLARRFTPGATRSSRRC